MTSPASRARERGVPEIVHFTTDKGILGSLRKRELLSRQRVQDDQELAFIFQDVWPRRDPEWLDYVSLSVSRINTSLYQRAKRNLHERWWGVLAFDVGILDHEGVWFTTTNNVYEQVCRRATGVYGFDAMFGASIAWGYQGSVMNRPLGMAQYLPTDAQAEVLYPGAIPFEYLRAVYVGEAQHRHLVLAWCDVLQVAEPRVEVNPERF